MTAPTPDLSTGTSSAVAQGVPGLWRRMACFMYEGVLLFGVLMIAGYLFSSLTQQRNALIGRTGLQAFLFVVLGIYFVWFWSHGGQTVAMRAWNIRVLRADGGPVSQQRALVRYLMSWLWFVPALALLWAWGLPGGGAAMGVISTGVLAFALLARLHPNRQFWHDAACGTKLVTYIPPRPQKR